ncbi:hypothetical protein LC593_20925 [Nostoc sp. CHAB 5844]|nr:hypothetical protein [Nostoc sp. CHAB 5844]
MPWFKSTSSEMGDYLPDDEATLIEGCEIVGGSNEKEARENCQEVASQYDAVESEVEPTKDEDTWNCKFKFWG